MKLKSKSVTAYLINVNIYEFTGACVHIHSLTHSQSENSPFLRANTIGPMQINCIYEQGRKPSNYTV